MKETVKKLNAWYYGIMALAIGVAVLFYLLIIKDVLTPLSPLSTLSQAVQYVIIFDVLITVPLGLYLHKRRCNTIALMEDDTLRYAAYYKSARTRILLVSNAMIPAIAAFYWMGAYQSMLWIAAIAAIGWYFTKPTERKMELELTLTT